jgi:peptide-methionine (S)-S-oxide reductase
MRILSNALVSLFILISFSSCAQKGKSTAAQKDDVAQSQDTLTSKDLSKYKQATFASGCFWCVEGVYESVNGVAEAISGYAGGETKNPTYEEVGAGRTEHAESVTVYYDSAIVDYPTLLRVFFASQDPTQVNGQGPDHGTQYRSIIFYRNDQEKKLALDYINVLNTSGKYAEPIAAQVVPFTEFWKAEEYHQDYIQHNPNNPYVKHESIPRIKRFQEQMPELIKPEKSLLGK